MAALIYGGRSPIALELCQQLAESGQEVHLITRNREKAFVDLARNHQCDLEDAERSIILALEIDKACGGLESIAFVHRYRNSKVNPLKQYEVEVYTPYRILSALSKQQRERQCAVVVFTSPGAHHVLSEQDFQYHASKAALSQLVRFGSVRFASKKIRINGISPGSYIFKQRAANYYLENPDIVERANKLIPLARMGTVSEVADVAFYLLSKRSSYINGQIFEVDGGSLNIDVR
jgi:3-oxoacyl-[acyl-carrier protein] reductase